MTKSKKRKYWDKVECCYCCDSCCDCWDCCTCDSGDVNIEVNIINYCPSPPSPQPPSNGALPGEVTQFTAISDGKKTVYTDEDKSRPFSTSNILGRNDVSYINLYINGMLQPTTIYEVQQGRLELLVSAEDIPRSGVPITIQFIKILSKPSV